MQAQYHKPTHERAHMPAHLWIQWVEKWKTTLLLLFFLFLCNPAFGKTPAAPTKPAAAMPLEWTPLTLPNAGFQRAALTTELGWLQIGEDHFLGLSFGTILDLGLFRAGIHAPLNLRVIDEAPESDTRVREEDWDETSDWFRILRFVEVGDPHRGPLYARFGELAGATLGHSTIVDYYYNNVLIDHYQAGISFRLDLGPVGGEMVLDNVADAEIFGLRGFARPFRFIQGDDGIFERMAVGLTLVGDTNAPYTINQVISPQNDRVTPQVSDTENLNANKRSTFILGLDAELRLVDTEEFRIEPYVDINTHVTKGSGTHWGILNRWNPTDEFQLTLRTEYRFLGPGYIPSYINALYEVERFQFYNSAITDTEDFPPAQTPSDFPGTKLRFAEEHANQAANGALIEVGATLFQALHLKGRYQGSGRTKDDELWLQAALPYLGDLQVSAIYLKRRAEGFEDLFELDEGLLTAEIRYRILGPLAIKTLLSREWIVTEDNIYETITTWQFGAVADFSY